MESIQMTIYYCSVSKSGQVLYSYNGGEPEIENLGALCLERTPPNHQWYFQTTGKKIFGFLMDEVYQYFVIVNEGLGKEESLKFLGHLRDEFREVAKKSLSRSMSNVNSFGLQELVSVIGHLVASLENVSRSTSSPNQIERSSSSVGNSDGSGSTKAPLLGKASKQEKKRMKDHVISVNDDPLEEHRKYERGDKVDSGPSDFKNGLALTPSMSLQKENGSFSTKSSSQNIRKKLCRQVCIILAIDVVICVVLFAVWLFICNGLKCVRLYFTSSNFLKRMEQD